MQQRIGSRNRRLQHFAWLAMALVVLHVLGWELHLAVEQHPPGESCEVCLLAERTGDALAASATQSPAAPVALEPKAMACDLFRTRLSPCPPPRGPPLHHG
jgi:hypothetical protein